MSDERAGAAGLIILLVLVLAGVTLLVTEGMKLSGFRYLDEEGISLKYGVRGIVEKRREDFEQTHRRCTVLGVALCIISVIPLMTVGTFVDNDIYSIMCFALLIVFAAVAVYLFVWSGCIYGSFRKLLQEGEYAKEKKAIKKRTAFLNGVYWAGGAGGFSNSAQLEHIRRERVQYPWRLLDRCSASLYYDQRNTWCGDGKAQRRSQIERWAYKKQISYRQGKVRLLYT